jgi:hypothetical protein
MAVAIESGIDHTELDSVSIAASEASFDTADSDDTSLSTAKYRPRGYHPIAIGDVLVNRYTIVHKLGYGGWSTIWLARDATVGRYVAIKIGLADSGSREIDILRELSGPNTTRATAHPGQSAIPEVLDIFAIHGPNGTHNVLVTAPSWCPLRWQRKART